MGAAGKEGLLLFPCFWDTFFPPPEDKGDFTSNAAEQNTLGVQSPWCWGGVGGVEVP